ncbi:MAG TPA: tetratricopeptide repeat protein [Pyrinomonadaceae bacterium]|nr:tetratricopeptide repeat protein [Pyrinomonadaceae bacterium]
MRLFLSLRTVVAAALFVLLNLSLAAQAKAQTEDAFGDAADPVKLFERGQNAHARGDLEKALEFYEQALRVRPDFPEAEFQRGGALVSLGRLPEAEAAFKRAIALKKNWSLPYSALGALFVKQSREPEAENMFRQALSIDPQDAIALRLLADLKLRGGAAKEALVLARKATSMKDAPASSWVVLAIAERANGDKLASRKILDQVLDNDPSNLAALIERADLSTEDKAYDAAIKDLQTADKSKPGDKAILSRLAHVYQQAGRIEEANAAAKAAGLKVEVAAGANRTNVTGTPEEIEAANSNDPLIARPALEKLIEKNPRSAFLLSKLGASYRTDKPDKALELYRRAAEIEPDSAEYAVGYAAALVQGRRFADAARVLTEVVKVHSDNYPARANLATALYEMKLYADAIPQYEWLLSVKPDVVVAYYFVATAHDYLGEYPDALSAYEKFLAKADPNTNQLEIDKVKLRLPTLRRQIQLGEGAKKKPSVK